jgi:hypothetical protein
MNCVPVPTLPLFPLAGAAGAAADAAGAAAGAGVAAAAIAADWDEKNAKAAMLFGWASPWPQPPSRVWAITGPAQRPELKPQHDEAQSASELQGPVMNWVPAEKARVVREERTKNVLVYIFVAVGK